MDAPGRLDWIDLATCVDLVIFRVCLSHISKTFPPFLVLLLVLLGRSQGGKQCGGEEPAWTICKRQSPSGFVEQNTHLVYSIGLELTKEA